MCWEKTKDCKAEWKKWISEFTCPIHCEQRRLTMEEGNACPAATPHQHSTLDMISLPTFTELSTQQRSSNKHNCRGGRSITVSCYPPRCPGVACHWVLRAREARHRLSRLGSHGPPGYRWHVLWWLHNIAIYLYTYIYIHCCSYVYSYIFLCFCSCIAVYKLYI